MEWRGGEGRGGEGRGGEGKGGEGRGEKVRGGEGRGGEGDHANDQWCHVCVLVCACCINCICNAYTCTSASKHLRTSHHANHQCTWCYVCVSVCVCVL